MTGSHHIPSRKIIGFGAGQIEIHLVERQGGLPQVPCPLQGAGSVGGIKARDMVAGKVNLFQFLEVLANIHTITHHLSPQVP